MSLIVEFGFDHVNQQPVYERMIAIRDLLGDIEARDEPITGEESAEIGRMFEGDMTLFRFMDEAPGHHIVNGRPPEGIRGGPGCYFDGQGREGWHRLLRQLRNEPGDTFWAPFHEGYER